MALQVILREGLDGVTVRGIAAEAGWSTGSLRHYFTDQHQLQAHVVQVATDTLRDRVLPRVQRARSSGAVIERVVSILEELLPLDAARQEEYALWTAVVEWERRHPPAEGSPTWRDQRALHRQCIALLRGQATTGDLDRARRPHPDPEVERWAALLHTFVDGLASQLVDTPAEITPAAARSLLRSLLQAVPSARRTEGTERNESVQRPADPSSRRTEREPK